MSAPPPRTSPQPALDPEALDRIVDGFWARGDQPGLAFGVVRDGRLVHGGGRGHRGAPGGSSAAPDADTVFRIASMTKSFTAAAVLRLRDEGLLRLDDEVARYVPALAALPPVTRDAPPVTVRALLTMTAGLPTDDPWGDRQQDLDDASFEALLRAGIGFAWAPGTAYEYSNLGYAILGRVVEAAAAAPYREVVAQRLLRPLGMTATAFAAEEVAPERLAQGFRREGDGWDAVPFAPYGAFAPMGGLFSSVRDLATWVGGFTDAFPPRDDPEGDHPLSRASRRELQQPHRGLPPVVQWTGLPAAPSVAGAAYGFGVAVELDTADGVRGDVVGHSGGYPGFGSHMRWHPAGGWGVVVLANATYAPAHRLAARLLRAVLDRDGAAGRSGSDPGAVGTGSVGTGRPAVRGPVPAPAPGTVWPATAAARAAVQGLLARWDADVAEGLFAANVDLDEPLERRRAEVDRVRDLLGGLEPDDGESPQAASAAHCAWWVRGSRGRARVEIRLTPQIPPLVQTLTVTPVPDPSPALRSVAVAVAAALGEAAADGEPRWPAVAVPAGRFDAAAARRLVLTGAAWAGTCTVGEVTASDGGRSATFRLLGARADLLLAVTVEADPAAPPGTPVRVTDASLRPAPAPDAAPG